MKKLMLEKGGEGESVLRFCSVPSSLGKLPWAEPQEESRICPVPACSAQHQLLTQAASNIGEKDTSRMPVPLVHTHALKS